MQKLYPIAWAGTAAFLWGIYLFLFPLFAMWKISFMWFSFKAFQVITYFYPGLTPTFGGAFLGLFYGIICGAICGWLFATIHNLILKFLK